MRQPKYNAKFMPQEYSLLHKVWELLGRDCSQAGVLDIGAGNANCAVLAASLLNLTVICVERESPRPELRAEAKLPAALRRRVIRLEMDVADFDASALQEVAAASGIRRFVVVAKHPCGIGVDRSIGCASRLRRGPGQASLVGIVMATCCTNKISFDDVRATRVPEFCGLYSKSSRFCAHQGVGAPFERVVETMSRCSAWRSASGSDGNAIHADQLAWAELFEDALQSLRLRRLEEVFGFATEVRFAPSECTLQDRCLVAAASPLPPGIWAHGEDCEDTAFVSSLRTAVGDLLAETGPIDCRPLGLKSSRYDSD